jgi:hypothetical protein
MRARRTLGSGMVYLDSFGLDFKKVWRQRRTLFVSVQDRLHSVAVLIAIPLLVNFCGRWFVAQHLVAVWFLDAAFAAAALYCELAVVVH